MQYLREANCVTDDVVDKVKTYLSNTQVDPNVLNLKKVFKKNICMYYIIIVLNL
jgi:hypothetical protein